MTAQLLKEPIEFKANIPDIFYLGDYYPYYLHDGSRNQKFDQWSGKILDLKEQKEQAIEFFYEKVDPYIGKNVALTLVPSHDPENLDSGLRKLVKKLASNGRYDASSCLKRFKKIEKLSHGGNRNISVHLGSIEVQNDYLIQEKWSYCWMIYLQRVILYMPAKGF